MERPVIASYGGGTNSTAMIIEYVNRGLPLDLILFADTGGEKPHTYQFIDTFSTWLVARGYPEVTIIKGCYPQQFIDGTLENECLRLESLPAKAFGYSRCASKWKREPQERYISTWEPALEIWAAGEMVNKLIGFDADEPHRAEHIRSFPDSKYELIFPLIDDFDFGRDECIAAIDAAGLPHPGKSACFFCPSSKKEEIFELRAIYPDLAERAVAMERNAKNLDTVKGLGRRWSWESLLAQTDLFPGEYEIAFESDCMCFDGE